MRHIILKFFIMSVLMAIVILTLLKMTDVYGEVFIIGMIAPLIGIVTIFVEEIQGSIKDIKEIKKK